MRWLCDEMLVRLARLLRAAGHDTALASGGAGDAALLRQMREEDRILVTRDRDLAASAGGQGVWLADDDLDAQAAELSAARAVDWRLAPFTRCLMDNTPLRPATADEIAAMPPTAAAGPGPFNACPACRRLFWPGSHVKRLAARLDRLAGAP
ncbi:MAG TPA: DUF5615 family PIN-like protein [Caulobacteraceae bacterium]|nr:DUF5615 family PIN-like protein [Caulobacteraceae bacterium]